jgi:hypothetical protein
MSLTDRLAAAERAAQERLDALEEARRRLEEALGQLEALVDPSTRPKPNGPVSNLALRRCAGCNREFMPSTIRQIYHSGGCRREHWARKKAGQRRQQREQPAADPEPAPGVTSCTLDAVLRQPRRETFETDREREARAQDRRADRTFALAGLRGLPQNLVEQRLALCRPDDAALIRAML